MIFCLKGGVLLGTVLDELKERCESQGLEVQIKPKQIETESPVKMLSVKIPAGRDFRELILWEDNLFPELVESEFELCKFIKDYEAIWSPSLKFIECELNRGNLRFPSTAMLRRLSRMLEGSILSEEENQSRLQIPSPNDDLKIYIQLSSSEHAVMCTLQNLRFTIGAFERIPRSLTIRFEGLNVSTHDDAKKLLLKLSNSVLFSLDLASEMPFCLTTERNHNFDDKRSWRSKDTIEINAPQYEYDSEPMALYWYARTAKDMPLLQFHAFYQALEFYFPVYSQRAAQESVRNLIKDPRFNVNRDTDIANILSIIKVSGGGRAFGDEKSQIKATIRSCVTSDELRLFIESDSDRKSFFDSKQARLLSDQKLSLSSLSADILDEVAQRIYDIRCRVVHTKASQDEFELLLPYSREERYLQHDIKLLEFVTRKVIVAGSRPLQV